MSDLAPTLSERQQAVLAHVVEEYVATGLPVGSKTLVERSGLSVSSSTVRNELAVLEEQGLLTHPHTSAGRVPTGLGYRFYVDRILEGVEERPSDVALHLDLSSARSEVDSGLQATTEALAQVAHLLALVSAPPLGETSVRHVEVLLLSSYGLLCACHSSLMIDEITPLSCTGRRAQFVLRHPPRRPHDGNA